MLPMEEKEESHHKALALLALLKICHIVARRVSKCAWLTLDPFDLDVLIAFGMPPAKALKLGALDLLIVNLPLPSADRNNGVRIWEMELGKEDLRWGVSCGGRPGVQGHCECAVLKIKHMAV